MVAWQATVSWIVLNFRFASRILKIQDFAGRIVKIQDFAGRILTAKQSVFFRIQVRASSQTKGLERGWKQRSRRVGRARLVLNYATLYRLLILRKKPTVLRSKRISKIQDSRVSAKKSRKRSRDLCSRCDTHLVYETWAACSQESVRSF